ncbi:BREX-2 system adenine-specific DNA-methyltransferase PglX, partial [Streptomyces sp. NPDC000931]|uniref:BREX-2 system adenine-specific DNA-methyltransferase PglX n=1 Tax=Streptomyces sp. NPDC000931 TaxID=3154372 RepID=UPI00332A693B
MVKQVDQPGSESEWVSSVDLPWSGLKSHPWSLSGGGVAEVFNSIQGESKISDVVSLIGRSAHTGSDDAYFAPRGIWERHSIGSGSVKPLVEGDSIRDWSIEPQTEAVFPYDDNLQASLEDVPLARMLWSLRQGLRSRQELGGSHEEVGLTWYEWSRWHPERFRIELGIGMSFVSTHAHFGLDRGGKVFNRSAPVVKLPEGAGEDQHLKLLGVLNSSVACFWLKQVSHDKGSQGVNEGFKSQEWERFYEFTGTKLKEFPLPSKLPLARSKEIDSLAQKLSTLEPAALVESSTPTTGPLEDTHAEHVATCQRMIALQEELDWDVYHCYGLIGDAQLAEMAIPDTADVPSVNLGERAFEIVLARRVEVGEASTEWFNRHGSTPITEIPDHWPDAYKKVVAKRIELIESDKKINLLERPEYKRRWQSEPWEKKQKAALKSWLLDKCEDRRLWFNADDYGD